MNAPRYFALFATHGTGHFRRTPVADLWRFNPQQATLDQFNTISGTQSIPGIKAVDRTSDGTLAARTVTGQTITIGDRPDLESPLAEKLIDQFDHLTRGLRDNNSRTIAWLKARGIHFVETPA